jgi:hypothetical protein
VVDLEAEADVAAGDDTFGVAGQEGSALGGGDGATEVDHGADVDAVGDDSGEEGVGHHGTDGGH